MRIRWLSVASFEIEAGDKNIITDPFISLNEQSPFSWKDIDKCDLIALSHSHYDHIGDIPQIMRRCNSSLVCGDKTVIPLARWSDISPMQFLPMPVNLELDFGWVKVKALYGNHSKLNGSYSEVMRFLSDCEKAEGFKDIRELQEIGTFEFRNFLFTFPDGKKILHWGNEFTKVQINMLRNLNPDVAIMQATGQQLSRIEDYSAFVKAIGAKMVIPHHMDLYRSEAEWKPGICELKERIEADNPNVVFIIPEHGKWIEL